MLFYLSHLLKLQNLQSQGVSGRIWGCSSVLSTCKNYSDLCPQWSIPDIGIVEAKHTGKYISDIGTRQVVTFTFNMEDTPQLNKILHNHVTKLINQKEKFSLKPT